MLDQESKNQESWILDSLASVLTGTSSFLADLCITSTLERKDISVGEKHATILDKAAE